VKKPPVINANPRLSPLYLIKPSLYGTKPMSIHKAKDNSFKLILENHDLFTAFLHDFIPNGLFAKYIPSFKYELVDLNTYSPEDLIRFKDVLSFIFLIDKIRGPEEIKLLNTVPKGYFEEVALKIPPGMDKIMSNVITILLNRVEVPREKIVVVTDSIEKKEDQTIFEGFVEAVLADKRKMRKEGIQISTERDIQIGTEKERERAYQDNLESARKFKARGFPSDAIAECLNLPPEVVEGL
jgi:hypothetical protein